MEKYLRLLNPKTTNFDAIGGGNFGALTREDVLMAISYARLSSKQVKLIRMYAFGDNTIEVITEQAQVLETEYCYQNHIDHATALRVALIELFACPATYKPSERNRAVLAGLSRMKIQRVVGSLIDDYRKDIAVDLKDAMQKVKRQINKLMDNEIY
ncbi:hypothetical protein [Acinetobacter sp. YH12251]|uniref:hypothetical protein n=1 Tax=Acinetobacter sp. YH12251 TaxID=2601176 RepID=UPI0015D2A484|nr:hypothetical protein [Acinetobacter sp. YH12251]